MLAVPLLVLHTTDSVVAAALATTPRTVGYLLVGLVAGSLVDRWDVRRTMLSGDIIRTFAFALMPTVAQLSGGAWLVIVVAFMAAAAGVFFETALAVAVQDCLDSDNLLMGNARLELSNQVGLLLGPSLIGVAIATIGVEKCLWLNAATFLASILTIIPLRFSNSAHTASRWSFRRLVGTWCDICAGFGYIRRHPLIMRLVSLQAVINFVIAVETLIVFHADRGLHANAAWIGVVLAAAGMGGIAATVVAGRFATRSSREKLIAWPVMGIGGSLLALAGALNPLQLAIANALIGALSVFASVHIRALRQQVVPRKMLGRVTATARTVALAANPVAAALFGFFTEAVGGNARWSFLTAAVLSVASAVVAYRGLLTPRAHSKELADPMDETQP